MSLPVNLQAEIDGEMVHIRELLDARPAIANELHERTELGRLLAGFGVVVAANIAARGSDMRALAWLEFLGGYE